MPIKVIIKDLFSTFALFTYLLIITILDMIFDLNLRLYVFFLFALLSLIIFIKRMFIIFKPFEGKIPY